MNRNYLVLLLLGIFLFSYTQKTIPKILSPTNSVNTLVDIPENTVHKSALFYNPKNSLWTLNGLRYSGYAVSFYGNGTLKEKFGVLNGRKQNLAIQWYSDGHYKYMTKYSKGKLHGVKKSWSPDSIHILVSHLNYISGKLHGEQRKWYSSGELFKKLNFNMGKEEGLQQAFRKNSALFANYEAREGRVFGLKKAALCFEIEDKNVKYER